MANLRVDANNTQLFDTSNTVRGILGESVPLPSQMTSGIPTAGSANGTLFTAGIPLRANTIITNVIIFLVTNGTSLTFGKCGLFDKNGNFLKATADISSGLNNAGNNGTFITTALTSTYTTTADDVYYPAFLQWGSGATGATIARGVSITGISTALGSGKRPFWAVASQTDISGNVTPAASTQAWYFALT